MDKNEKFPNKLVLDFVIGLKFWIRFEFRYSDFGLCLAGS